MILGYTLLTKPEDIYRTLIEATAFGTRKIVETFIEYHVPVDEIIIAGGIAEKNPFIMQIYADVIGRTIHIAGSKQNAALSSCIWAALAAGKENGGYDDIKEAADNMGNIKNVVYSPNPENKAAYDQLYKEYEVLHDYFGRGINPIMNNLKKRMNECRRNRKC